MGKRIASSTDSIEKIVYSLSIGKKLDWTLVSYKILNKNKLELNKILESTKLLEENIGDKLRDMGHGNDFLDMTAKA